MTHRLHALALPLAIAITATAHPSSAAADARREAIAPADDPAVAALVARALARNRDLAAAALDVDAAELVVRDARSQRLPSVDFDARATKVFGNQLDLGDLVNPAYQGLNQVLGEERYPTDVELKLPLGFESKVRISAPVWAPRIAWGERLARLGVTARRDGVALTRREVAAGVRAAYLGHARAALIVRRLRESRPLLEENLRVSRALVAADRGFADAVHRADAELAAFDQQIREVEQAQAAAARALAVVVGAPVGDIAVPDALPVPADVPVAVDAATAHARAARAELRLLATDGAAAGARRGLARAGYLPTLGVALDVGAARKDPLVTTDDVYAAVSATVTWNLFDGGRDRRASSRAALERSQAEVRRAQLADRIEAEVRDAHDAARVALAAIAAVRARQTSAQSAYDIVAARYREGDVPQIDLLQAQTALITARTDEVVAITEYYLRQVELVRAAALDEEVP